MSEIFLKIVNMSISVGWLILVVMVMRLLLKKAPGWVNVILWGLVALRLVMPFSIESIFSLIPSSETVNDGIMQDMSPTVDTGIPVINDAINPVFGSMVENGATATVSPLKIWIPVLAIVWCIGMGIMLVYTVVTYARLRYRIMTAVRLRDNIYQSENVDSPFVLGVIRPGIYMPFNIKESDVLHVIAHEQAHIRRGDHLWKPLGFALLTVHWFNPLMWLGYVLLCRDIELACDEKVIREFNSEQKADYSQALLNCSVNRRMITACPVAFGETDVQVRVKSVLSYKRPAFWLIAVAILASIAVAVCFLTNPPSARLKNIENLTLNSLTDPDSCIWISDGEKHRYIGAVDEDVIQELGNIGISDNPISQNRDSNRDKKNSLIIGDEPVIGPASSIQGIYIHFNEDFSQVWVETGVKPTLTYKVVNPQDAKAVYDKIAALRLQNTGELSGIGSDEEATLRQKYPEYFDLPTDKGLEVYVWSFANNNYNCGLLPARETAYSYIEIDSLKPATMEEMRAIIACYDIEIQDVELVAARNRFSSYYYEIDREYYETINRLFWGLQ